MKHKRGLLTVAAESVTEEIRVAYTSETARLIDTRSVRVTASVVSRTLISVFNTRFTFVLLI